MDFPQLNWIANYIWGIAGDVLCDIVELKQETAGLLDEVVGEAR